MKKKRKDCFFGVHFDFHANLTSQGIGEKFDGEELRSFIREIRPDFLQCDVKGHNGYSSYPTMVGIQAPNIQKDILRIWREITEEEGVLLYAHYSGILDGVQNEKHKDWRCVYEPCGTTDKWATSLFSPYDETILIPQLIELATEYRLDGAWVDGECWAAMEDYSPKALSEYSKTNGAIEFKEFHREAFRRHVRNYLEKVKEVAPNFEMTSNWIFTEQLPEKPTVDVDFLSGDVIPRETVDATKFGPRVIANQHKVWDLISWSTDFYLHYEKSALQLCCEAADIIAMGGAYQIYCVQDYKAFMQNETFIPTLKEVAKFCRDRQEYCHQATIRKEVAVLLSEKGYFYEREPLFGRGGEHIESVKGSLLACLDNQYSTEILLGYNALEDISEYKTIIVSQLRDLEENVKSSLLEYAKNGGHLIIIGADSILQFAEEFGYNVEALEREKGFSQLLIGKSKLTVENDFLVIPEEGTHRMWLAEMIGRDENAEKILFNNAGGSFPLPRVQFTKPCAGSIVRAYGEGTIVGVPFDMGGMYLNARTYQMRDFLGEIIALGYKNKKVQTNTKLVEVILTEKDGREFVQFVNMAKGPIAGWIKSYDEALPLRNVQVSYLCDKPKRIMRFPENTPLEFTYKDGRAEFTIDELCIHTVVEICKN